MKSCRLLLITVLLCGAGLAQRGEEDSFRAELYLQYSAANTGLLNNFGFNINHTDLAQGVRAGGAWLATPNFALVADVAHHGISDPSGHFGMTSFTAGPRYSGGERYRMSVFGQLLLGAVHEAQSPAATGFDQWREIAALGGGLNIRVTKHVVLRPIQFDVALVGTNVSPVSSARFSSGVAFRWAP